MNKVYKKSLLQKYSFFSHTNIFISATGTLLQLAGNNTLQPEGKTAIVYTDNDPI